MQKAKQYDWKDSNLALFGSDTEKQVKKASAATEPAWSGSGQEVGLKVWRIVKFKVTDWPKEDYGKFFEGDSYIVLNTYKEGSSDNLLMDVHFWIGKLSTQDEYGTAAYKTVELDTFLDDKPVQHREVQGHESELFKSYFSSISILKGGADTGFRHVKPEEYTPRLLQFNRVSRRVEVTEIPLCKSRITQDDVFILDLGLKIYQYNGDNSSKDERFKAMQYCQNLESERNGRAKADVLEGGSTGDSHEFFAALTGDDEPDDVDEETDGVTELYRISDEDGSMDMEKAKEGTISKEDFESKDVFLMDTKKEVFVWIGSGASVAEKKNAMAYAHNYLKKTNHPLVPVSCLSEGRVVASFEAALAA
ncbi:gelsolin-like protein 1 [Patella vulgata]|uniref:gelsolin-like protein 1 n=1 Tax=Patella vulgata TaxID=6465 RepID=UPI00218047BF|nr:gelsolin-like protein 1 [Patella vulgata]